MANSVISAENGVQGAGFSIIGFLGSVFILMGGQGLLTTCNLCKRHICARRLISEVYCVFSFGLLSSGNPVRQAIIFSS